MSLTKQDSETLAQYEDLESGEKMLVNEVFATLYGQANRLGVPVLKDDRAATLEAALIRLIIASR